MIKWTEERIAALETQGQDADDGWEGYQWVREALSLAREVRRLRVAIESHRVRVGGMSGAVQDDLILWAALDEPNEDDFSDVHHG